jgi:hypothetical protein
MKKAGIKTRQLIFYWITSFLLGVILYIFLNLFDNFGLGLMGNGRPFDMWLHRDYLNDYWGLYIFIVCFFYSIFAALFANKFAKSGIPKQIGWMALIIALTILASSPLGGILTYYLDMEQGYFPDNWLCILLTKGVSDGILSGWFFIVISFPYNILCAVGGYFLTKAGSKYF